MLIYRRTFPPGTCCQKANSFHASTCPPYKYEVPNEVFVKVFNIWEWRRFKSVSLLSELLRVWSASSLFIISIRCPLKAWQSDTSLGDFDHHTWPNISNISKSSQTITIAAERSLPSDITKRCVLTEPQGTFVLQPVLQTLPSHSKSYNLKAKWRPEFQKRRSDA